MIGVQTVIVGLQADIIAANRKIYWRCSISCTKECLYNIKTKRKGYAEEEK